MRHWASATSYLVTILVQAVLGRMVLGQASGPPGPKGMVLLFHRDPQEGIEKSSSPHTIAGHTAIDDSDDETELTATC